jgi:hypothetical protein
MSEHDLTDKRVSSDDAMREVIRAKARVIALQKELAAVKRDRDDALNEYNSLREAKFPVKRDSKPRPRPKTKTDTVRLIANDVHGSMMDRAAVEAFLGDVRRLSPDEIILNGDIVDCSGFLALHHTLGFVPQTAYTYQDDIAHANWFLDQIQDAAPSAKIHYLEGNHEDRVERWAIQQTLSHSRESAFLHDLVSPEKLLSVKERGIAYYRRSIVHVKGLPPGWIKLGKIFFVHQLGNGKNAARDAVTSAGGNVVYADTHREDSASIVLPGVGLLKAWNPGCLCELQPLYCKTRTTGWSHGYGYEVVAKSGEFMHVNVPIWEGRSLLGNMMEGK